jgi:hypothetical protein
LFTLQEIIKEKLKKWLKILCTITIKNSQNKIIDIKDYLKKNPDSDNAVKKMCNKKENNNIFKAFSETYKITDVYKRVVQSLNMQVHLEYEWERSTNEMKKISKVLPDLYFYCEHGVNFHGKDFSEISKTEHFHNGELIK